MPGYGGSEGEVTIEEVKAHVEKRLFVGRLQPGVNEQELQMFFSNFGDVTELRLVADKSIAFVGFTAWAATHRALLASDQQPALPSCAGQPMSVNFAERSGGRNRGGDTHKYAKGMSNSRIFVGDLPSNVTDDDVRRLFEPYGVVEGANLIPGKAQITRRCAFVNFSLWGEALDAIEGLDGQQYPGADGVEQTLKVKLATPRDPGAGGGSAGGGSSKGSSRSSPYGGASNFQPNPSMITQGFSQELEALKVAYITAIDTNAADEVCSELHKKILAVRMRPVGAPTVAVQRPSFGRAVSSTPFSSGLLGGAVSNIALGSNPSPAALATGAIPCEDRDAARLFVGGLPYECTEEELRALIVQIPLIMPPDQGQLIECRVLSGRGCGYVRFSSWDAAAEILKALDQRAVTGWQKPLNVKWATKKH